MRVILRRAVTAALVASLAAPATAAAAGPGRHGATDPEALAHLDAAESAFQAGEYDTATVHFKAAYAVEQRPEILYAWAQVERIAGNHRVAAGLYEAFLEQAPESRSAGQARAHAIEMRALAGGDPKPSEQDPVDTDQDPGDTDQDPGDTDQEPDDTDQTGSPFKGEWIAPTLLGAGAAIAIAGGVVMVLGRNRVAASSTTPTEQAYFSEISAGRQVYYAGAGTLGAGGLIMIGGAIRYALVARSGGKPKPKKTQASAVVTRTGFSLSLSGRF